MEQYKEEREIVIDENLISKEDAGFNARKPSKIPIGHSHKNSKESDLNHYSDEYNSAG